MAEIEIAGDEYNIECSIAIDGKTFDIFFRSPLPVLDPNGDVGVALGVLAAMRAGESLIVRAPVQDALLTNIEQYQEIMSTWNPKLNRVTVKGESGKPSHGQRVATFFSGGVDSFYTAWKHNSRLDDWIMIRGFDISLTEHDLWNSTQEAGAKAAKAAGKRLVEVHTNLRELSNQYLGWHMFHGAALAAVGLAMRKHLKTLLVASSFNYRDLFPWGSHPLLDPLWGGGGLQVIHDGSDLARVEKVRAIAEWPVAMEHLRVCYMSVPGQYNCGRCEKCLRTNVNLYAVGALGRCATLPTALDIKAIRRQFITNPAGRSFVRENLAALPDIPEHDEVRRALKRTIGPRIPLRAKKKVLRLLPSHR